MFYVNHLGRMVCRSLRSGKPCGLHKKSGPHDRCNPVPRALKVQPIERVYLADIIDHLRKVPIHSLLVHTKGGRLPTWRDERGGCDRLESCMLDRKPRTEDSDADMS